MCLCPLPLPSAVPGISVLKASALQWSKQNKPQTCLSSTESWLLEQRILRASLRDHFWISLRKLSPISCLISEKRHQG